MSLLNTDDPDPLRVIRCLRFTSGDQTGEIYFRLSALWDLEISSLKLSSSRTDTSGVHDLSPRVPLDWVAHIEFGSSGFRNLNF
jgi:hypothetical protein